MAAEIDISGYAPNLVVNRARTQILIDCEMVEHTAEGPRRSGKRIHLGLTIDDAMRLLALLKDAQRRLELPDYPLSPTMTEVPRAKDRN